MNKRLTSDLKFVDWGLCEVGNGRSGGDALPFLIPLPAYDTWRAFDGRLHIDFFITGVIIE